MSSPPRPEKKRTHSPHLPKGDCRYILFHPGFKGIRCACVGFALNRTIPGSTCDCGHQACYHTPERENTGVSRQEIEALQAKVGLLEEQLDRQRHASLVERLARVEDLVDRNKTDIDAEVKNIYRALSGLWQNVGALNKRASNYDDSIEGLADDAQRMRNRLIEVDDASIKVEERVDALESSLAPRSSRSRRRRASTPPSTAWDVDSNTEQVALPPEDYHKSLTHLSRTHSPQHVQLFRERVSSVGVDPRAWTVHISLLPMSSQPFPFEKDTVAYKRCLSRGLHQMLVIPDSESSSFRTAVDEGFSKILLGRSWQPLVAQLCNAKNLRGLPMLRQLPPELLECDYDVEFLQRNCAVVDGSGKILDLYIAMSDVTISWAELKDISPFTPGLEAAWEHDQYLDPPGKGLEGKNSSLARQPEEVAEKRPAGDIISTWSPTLKRGASEISRTPSFGPSVDGDDTRSKLRRQCTGTSVEFVGWRAEAV